MEAWMCPDTRNDFGSMFPARHDSRASTPHDSRASTPHAAVRSLLKLNTPKRVSPAREYRTVPQSLQRSPLLTPTRNSTLVSGNRQEHGPNADSSRRRMLGSLGIVILGRVFFHDLPNRAKTLSGTAGRGTIVSTLSEARGYKMSAGSSNGEMQVSTRRCFSNRPSRPLRSLPAVQVQPTSPAMS
jgi:hypothetical protein